MKMVSHGTEYEDGSALINTVLLADGEAAGTGSRELTQYRNSITCIKPSKPAPHSSAVPLLINTSKHFQNSGFKSSLGFLQPSIQFCCDILKLDNRWSYFQFTNAVTVLGLTVTVLVIHTATQ